MKVSVTLLVEFDAEDWKAANGMSPDASASEVRQSAKDYIGNAVQQLSMIEDASAKVRWR